MVLSTNRYNFLYASNEIIFLLSLVALQLEVLVIASLLLLPYLEMEKQLSCSMDVQRFGGEWGTVGRGHIKVVVRGPGRVNEATRNRWRSARVTSGV